LRFEGPTPNPFRATTTLHFAVAGGGAVRIRVYDVSGRAVRHLLAARVDDGEHRVTWDGRDDEGRPVRAGIYFLRLEAPGIERIVKTALLR
jgi:flagellar hook assembly protein FlgD